MQSCNQSVDARARKDCQAEKFLCAALPPDPKSALAISVQKVAKMKNTCREASIFHFIIFD
jgi:hypothetical protein